MRMRLTGKPSYTKETAQLGEVMVGGTVGQVTESQSDKLKVGDYVVGYGGWQSHWVCNADRVKKVDRTCSFTVNIVLMDM